ncbi:GBS Bsp-like repeat-containing protein [Streptococcus respiraculi]|uniref:GBS Bsp-like repeat-containing protein n=1 Tax=Streptococcus respiraculi TaxID=2021971 RepID=UPI000E752A47|nr:GBS Bsp-like repeat-containing protein [Streptococcus respiraculi]
MKLRSLVCLSGMVLACWMSPVTADSVITPLQPLTQARHEVSVGNLQVVAEDGKVKAILSQLPDGYEPSAGTLWTKEDKSDQVTISSFEKTETGDYEAVLVRDAFAVTADTFYLQVEVRNKEGQVENLEPYPFQWALTPPTSSASSSSPASSADDVSSSSSSLASVSRVEPSLSSSTSTSSAVTSSSSSTQTGSAFRKASNGPTAPQSKPKVKQEAPLSLTESRTTVVSEELSQELRQDPTEAVEIKPSGKIEIQRINENDGTFDVLISDIRASQEVQGVRVPVWTSKGGQDDLRWYDAERQLDGTYHLRIDNRLHHYETGSYHVHYYYRYKDGSQEGIGTIRTELPVPTRPSGKIEIQRINENDGTFDVLIRDIRASQEVQGVRVPVWTSKGGRNDLRWYDAERQLDGTYHLRIDNRLHYYETGSYHVHYYYRYKDGSQEGIGTIRMELPVPTRPSGKIEIQRINENDGTFDVLISDIRASQEVQGVRVPVWTSKGGQDDLRWYDAERQLDGTYHLRIDNRLHHYETGSYHVHYYYRYKDGSQEGIGTIRTELPVPTRPSGKIEIHNQNSANGRFDVVISNLRSPQKIQRILIPVWSAKKGRDDLRWYEATKQKDGSYAVSVDPGNHSYDQGLYHVHWHVQYTDGTRVGAGTTRTTVSIKDVVARADIAIQKMNHVDDSFEVHISNLRASTSVDAVYVPVWADINGQNDIIWYKANKQVDGSYRVMVHARNHQFESGIYHAELYILSQGKRYRVSGTKTHLNVSSRSPKAFVDVSSHNSSLSVSDYRNLSNQGVAGVVVKLTEGTSYINPFAAEQIRNAQAVGVKVSVYHYSHFTDARSAQEEARYFVAAAQRLGLSKDIVMVNDIEEYKTRNNINANMKSWENEMHRLGYNNLVHYTSASWIDVNTLGYAGPIQTGQFGLKNFWVAQYPYNSLSVQQARNMNMHPLAAAWQFTSSAQLLSGRHVFDLNLDYTGRFTD